MQDPAQLSGRDHVDGVIEELRSEFQSLMLQRAEILSRIGTIKQTIIGLANLLGNEMVGKELLELVDRRSSIRQPGFTGICRLVLMESNRPLTSREVCQEIQRRNSALLARHKDPLASVTTVLSRLARYGEARVVPSAKGPRVWEWVTEKSLSALDSANGNGIVAHPNA